MEYSLYNLNRISRLQNLTLNHFIEKLNLIGLEVDNLASEKLSTNVFHDNLQLLLKIPANREDLLNEKFFIRELSTIFLFEIYELWEKLKKNYIFILEEKALNYSKYSRIVIFSEKPNIVSYLIKVENVNVTTSPLWITNKLIQFGLKPKNNINDILTLVFHEWGQNINILDSTLFNNQSTKNFKFESLVESATYDTRIINKEKIKLDPGTVILKEDNNIISFFGNNDSSFIENSEKKLLFSFFLEATFSDIHENSVFVNNKVSLKFLRRAFLQNFKYSFQRLLTLLELITFCTIEPIIYSTDNIKNELKTTKIVKLRKQTLVHFLNIRIPEKIIFQKASLQLVCETKKEYYFKIPTSRHDLVREIDLIEEYSRFIGYTNFKEILPKKDLCYTKNIFREITFIKTFFLNYGFHEVVTNPINDLESKNRFSILINNPLNNELSVLRRSLIPRLLNVFELNSRSSYIRSNFFEIGRTFKLISNKISEEDKLAGIFQLPINKSSKRNSSDWFIAKGFIENFLLNFGYKEIEIRKVRKRISFFHSTRSILFLSKNRLVGIFGEINPVLMKERYSHVRETIYLFELNINYLKKWKLNSEVNAFIEYSKYPLIVKDLSLIMNKETNFNSLKCFILTQSLHLKKVTFFDIYFDETIIENVSVGIRLEFQSENETLTNEIIEKEIERIKILLFNNFNINIRI